MKNRKILLPALVSVVLVSSLILGAEVANASSARTCVLDNHTIIRSDDNSFLGLGDNDLGCCDVGGWTDIIQVEAGYRHTVGLKADHTVVAVRDKEDTDYGECNVGGWTDIIQVSAGGYHTVGLKSDGTCVAVGRNEYGECDLSGWTGIIQVSAGGAYAAGHTVGLKSDGTCVAAGWNEFHQCDLDNWTDIIQVSAGRHFTVGLKSDGTAVAIGRNWYGQCDVGDWTGIVQVSAGAWHTVGRKPDGTCIAVGCSDEGWNSQWGQCDVYDWTGIIHASAGGYHTAGLKNDHTAVAVGTTGDHNWGQCEVADWSDIIQVDAGKWHTVGLKDDGTVVAVGGQKKIPLIPNLCFIATAAYGTPMAEEIEILREFRDAYLLTNPLGQALVDFYYTVSPPIAEFITEHPSLKPIVRAWLLPAVAMSALAVNTTPVEKTATAWTRRRRHRGPKYT